MRDWSVRLNELARLYAEDAADDVCLDRAAAERASRILPHIENLDDWGIFVGEDGEVSLESQNESWAYGISIPASEACEVRGVKIAGPDVWRCSTASDMALVSLVAMNCHPTTPKAV